MAAPAASTTTERQDLLSAVVAPTNPLVVGMESDEDQGLQFGQRKKVYWLEDLYLSMAWCKLFETAAHTGDQKLFFYEMKKTLASYFRERALDIYPASNLTKSAPCLVQNLFNFSYENFVGMHYQ